MPLDEQAATWLEEVSRSGLPSLNEMPVDQARQTYLAVVAQCGLKPEAVASRTERTIPGPHGPIPIRVYTPQGSGPFPVLVYFHGGGWVIGHPDAVDGPCTALANRAHAVVVSVDYRLAPEHPFPAPLDDCLAATTWVTEQATLLNGDPERIAVGGDSAGGNLAAVVSLLCRDQGGPMPLLQLLIYPATDVASDTASYRDNGEGYFLTSALMKWFYDHYLPDQSSRSDWRASPLRAPDLGNLPPALIITAEYDPLRDEGEAYGMRLVAAGNLVTMKRYQGQIHAFAANLAGVMTQGKVAIEQAAWHLRQAFRGTWDPRTWL